MPIDSKHPDYSHRLKDWETIRDNLGGSSAIKARGEVYLPRVNPADQSEEANARYRSYLKRADYFAATRETQKSNVGRCFVIDPIYEVPQGLEALITNVDGGGVSINQQAKFTLGNVTAYSRAGLFVDYPDVPEGEVVSVADQEAGFFNPKIIAYDPFSIINWDIVTVGAKVMLSLVVLEEQYVEHDDGFEQTYEKQWRELRLEDGVYVVRVYRLEGGEYNVYSESIPRDGSGQPFTEIPFVFVGAETNSHTVEYPQLLDIANLNISHFQVSADEAQHLHTLQPTVWLGGLNQQWVDAYYPGGVVPIGSSSAILLPDGGQAGILEPREVSGLAQAKRDKKEQMDALGAKLVEQSSVQKTATEKTIDEAARSSVLAANCNNVSVAYERSLRFAAAFMGIDGEGIRYEIDTEFAVVGMTPEQTAALTNLYNAGGIDYEEYRAKLKLSGVAWKDDDLVKSYHEDKQEAAFAQARAAFQSEVE